MKAVWREDLVDVPFLKGMAEIADKNTIVVCVFEEYIDLLRYENKIVIITSNKKNTETVRQILATNAIKFKRVRNIKNGFFTLMNKIGFVLQKFELDKVEEAFKTEKIEKITRINKSMIIHGKP